MAPDVDDEDQYFILSREEADRLVTEALDAQFDEPEQLVRLLLRLSDNADHPGLKDTIHTLIKAAFDNSIVHSLALQEYLEAIREGQNPLEAARARLPSPPRPDL